METTQREIYPESGLKREAVLRCKTEVASVMDAMYILGGKWRVPITIALMEGNTRFGEIQKAVDKITSKVLSHELKEMELNGFVERKIYGDNPARIEYELTEYSWLIKPVILALRDFGVLHRDRLRQEGEKRD